MRKLLRGIKHFFFPPPGSPRWVRVLPFAILGMVTALAIYGSVEAWTYTNSPAFCGSTCHTMPPEFSSYLRSPHARVQCVECHLGRDVFTTQFSRKAGDLRHVIKTVTVDYEFPIYAHDMRPATDSCERCHFPEKFSDDSLREIRHYGDDLANTPEFIYLILKTGGGTQREGLGRGIHWHIENEVYFLATDPLQQEIPYVRVVEDDGSITEYYDIASGVTPDDVAGTHLERMDCITCHNRVTHGISSPEEAVDQALKKHLISIDLPYVRQQSVALLRTGYESTDAARAAFETLTTYYVDNYPDVAAAQSDQIRQVIATLNDIYVQSIFPEQKIDWETHPDNLGHKDFPGCFRCHDGKHLTGTGESIRLECNLCHSIPQRNNGFDLVTTLEIVRGPEPPSHTHSNWISLHGQTIDQSCAICHKPASPDVDYTQLNGTPLVDGSFCGNVACHANKWTFAGFDTPELLPVLERQAYILQHTSPYLSADLARTYTGTFKAMLDGRCVICHSGPEAEAGLDLSRYAGILTGGKDGPALIAGDVAGSLIIQRQTESAPHFGQMLDDEIEAMTAWIAAGAPEK